ncbi:hypothetical protein KKD19_04705 [Patescibacteria group bacterium]|nr:hypothetical protein [Patescibacteria group bacterium]MBU4512509.1 hypothetical protein [Patescibacteria group bacterium]MCG2693512.1 hypothetical protein [Candidatus Parcubacteria bacterium]
MEITKKQFDSLATKKDIGVFGKNLENKISSTDKRLDTVDKRLDTVDKRLDTVDKQLDTVDKRLDTVARHVLGNADGIQRVEEKVDSTNEGMQKVLESNDKLITKLDAMRQEQVFLSGTDTRQQEDLDNNRLRIIDNSKRIGRLEEKAGVKNGIGRFA